MNSYCVVFAFISFFLFSTGCASNGCILRDYKNGGHVCVCNSSYCDQPEPLPPMLPRHYYLYTSSKDGLRFNLTRKSFSFRLKSRSVVFNLDDAFLYQEVKGFGGAFTDSAGLVILTLSKGAQLNLMESYFGSSGIGYTFGRVPIGGSDFSTRPYTYADHVTDLKLEEFNLTEEDFRYKIPLIKKALELSNNAVRILAAAWTAPPWMKTNEDYSGLGFLKEEYHRLWAQYHIKFLEEYQKQGIQIWALSTGNEPLNGAIPFFPFNCMGWTPLGQRTWVAKHLGPLIKESVFNSTLLLALDDQRFELPWWLKIMFHKNEATPYIDGVGVHWYWDHIAPSILLDKTHEAFPDKFILSTEACFTKRLWESNPVHLGSWSRGEQYAESVINDMNHWVAGWVDWNLALDLNGGPNWAGNFVDASVIVNSTADEFYKQPMFYALGHFSKFVPIGSRRIGLTGGNGSIKGVAFLTPQDLLVVVILNKRGHEQAVSIQGAPRGTANFLMPAKSLVTFICRNKKLPLHKILEDERIST